MKKNILISCVGGLFFFDFLKCLKSQKDFKFKIIGTDNDPKAYGKVLVDKFYNSNGINSEIKFFNYFKKIIKNEGIDIIIPLSDNEIRFFYKYKKDYLKIFPKLKFSFFENQNFDIFLNKSNFYNFCRDKNIEIGDFSIITKFNQLRKKINKNKKYILKSTTDSGSKNVFLINDRNKKLRKILNDRSCYETNLNGFKKFYNPKKKYILSDYYEGNGYDVDCFSIKGEVKEIIVRQRLMFNKFMYYSPGHKIIQNLKIKKLIEKFIKLSKYTGISDFDIVESKGKYILIDTSCRFSGSVGISHLAGVNFPLMLIKYIIGQKFDKNKIRYNISIKPFLSFQITENDRMIEKYISKFYDQIKI